MKLNFNSRKFISLVGKGGGSWGHETHAGRVPLNSRYISLSATFKAKYCCSAEDIEVKLLDLNLYGSV